MQRLVCILATCFAVISSQVSAQQPDETEYLSERDWQIPITLSEPIRREATLLTLYVSTDQGKSWRKESTAKPTDEFFKYVAPGDGNYWFSVSFVNRSGQTVPARDSDLQPQLRIVVDTRRPDVKLQTIERQGNQVTVAWDVKDEHLDLTTLQLQYKAKDSSAWHAIALSSGMANGTKQIDVGTPGPVTLRLSVKDRAGNTGEEQTDVLAAQMTTSAMQPPSNQTGGNSTPVLPSFPAPTPPALTTSNNPAPAVHQTLPKTESNLPVPLAGGGNNTATSPAPPSFGTTKPANDGFKPVTGSPPWNNSAANAGAGQGGYSGRTRTQAGNIQWTNSLHLDLDFELKAGPSGIGVVELYYTLDAGKTWQLMERREDAKPPFSIDVPGEGIYGFTMVAKNKVGMGRPAPTPGEAPEIRVGVDITAPVCELITPVEAVPGRRDMVAIKWSAMDNNLASTPVKLEWADNPNGPWQVVVERTTNTGNYLWRVPGNIPPQVFLKLEVYDMAGNVGAYVTREPVIVDLQEPEVKLKALLPAKK
jgi:hypothetical protein